MQIELLQKYLFIPLDIFKKSRHNRNINDKRDAWLTLFTSDEPEEIIEIIEEYPEFRAVYEEGYEICLNVERVMEMFSKELYELDKNTVQYMIDEMQDTIDAQKGELDKQNQTIEAQKDELDKQQDTIAAQKDELEKKNQIIEELHRKILSAQ